MRLLFLSHSVNSLLVQGQILSVVLKLAFLVFDLLFEVRDFVIVHLHRVLQLLVAGLLLDLDVGFEGLDALIDFIQSSFLDKDLFRADNGVLGYGLFDGVRVRILDTEAGKSTINTD